LDASIVPAIQIRVCFEIFVDFSVNGNLNDLK